MSLRAQEIATEAAVRACGLYIPPNCLLPRPTSLRRIRHRAMGFAPDGAWWISWGKARGEWSRMVPVPR